ncbi:MAG: glutamate--cysteine ligase [Ectothiorhodospiraceae bacterium]|nr:glutamate--cysteine ligase [Ectothiorhodospiraceae bacterium]
MGENIRDQRFTREDFQRFSAALREETALLKEWIRNGRLSHEPLRVGYEVEAWLVDEAWRPAPVNGPFLEAMDDPNVVPELAQFNMELNGPAEWLQGQPFSAMQRSLDDLWARCRVVGGQLGVNPLMIGILPTAREEDFCIQHMSRLPRYRALNEQVLKLRNQVPLQVEIQGPDDAVRLRHTDVMLEAAATSLQLHLQLTAENAPRYFNAAQLLSAGTVAVAANSPFLFGHALWQETRIPLFEQAVAVDPVTGARGAGALKRVSFGSGYGRDGLYQLFVENRQHYPVLLPVHCEGGPERLRHLKLHNGTIWRWNRPLVDFNEDGVCHLRLEHRVMAAGPSILDTVANAAFFHGAVHALASREHPPEAEIPFASAEANFYRAARDGIHAELDWLGGARVPLRELLLESLIPKARQGLEQLGLPPAEFQPYLDVIEARVRTGRTGAAWQQAWVRRHGPNFEGLVADYWKQQTAGTPVHEWSL